MSRSYKKFPACTDAGRHGSRKDMRTLANRCVRRKMNTLTAQSMDDDDAFVMTSPRAKSSYKKHFESYDIHDYKFICSRKNASKKWESDRKKALNGGLWGNWYLKNQETIEDYLKWWEKHYYRK